MQSLLICALAAWLALGCNGDARGSKAILDAPLGGGVDAAAMTLPSWMLEDVQPQSPRAGQTYGLETFSGKIVVVTLLEGF